MEIELDSLDNNILNNQSSNCDENKCCYLKTNGFHCNDNALPFKTDYSAVTSLDLSKSELSSIPTEVNELKNLLILNISHNYLENISQNLRNNNLTKLIAAFNRFTIDQTLIDRIIASFPSLTKLNLCYQSINNQLLAQKCNQLSLNNCELQYVNLSGNQLSHLNNISGNTSLKTFILHSNGMSTIPLFKCCQQLQVLDLSNNCFDDKLLTGNHLDILFNNCPSLKHLDMITSGGFNARNVINKSQYLTVPVSEKLIHFIDIGSINHCQIALSNSFINSSICVEVLSESEMIIGLINGTEFAPIIKSNFSAIIESELGCIETRKDYLKNSILSCFKLLSDHKCEDLKNVNIIVSHMIFDSNTGSVTIKLSTCGQWTTLRQVSLKDSDNNNSSPKIINLCSKLFTLNKNKNGFRDNNFIADPICHELTLNPNDMSAILMGINIVDHDEECITKLFTQSLMTLTDKLKRYTEVINSRNYLNNSNSCDNHCFGANFLAIAIHPKIIEENNRCEDSSVKSSISNTSDQTIDSSEHSEKFRSWEYILEENHKCLFNKELEALKDIDSNKFDSISSRNGKSSHSPIITLQQFITKNEKFKKYDTNTFKVYKI